MNADTLYFRGLAGRWRPLPGPDRWGRLLPERFHQDAEQLAPLLAVPLATREENGAPLASDPLPLCVCEVCHDVVIATGVGFVIARLNDDAYDLGAACDAADLPSAAGDHRHDDDLPAGEIRWYRLRAIGPWKDRHQGTLAELLAMDPKLISPGWPVPPGPVINEFLASGRHDAGNAGGLEFPPMQVDPAAYAGLHDALLQQEPGLVQVDVPAHVVDRGSFFGWWDGVLAQFPRSAHDELQQRVVELLGALGAHDVGSSGYDDALAAYRTFMANKLTVLETLAAS